MKDINILLAEDDLVILNNIESFLSKNNIHVYSETNGFDALTSYLQAAHNNCPISVCILDIMMPNITGIELCEKIKKMNPQTIVIIISALKNQSSFAYNAGADLFLEKPFDLSFLLSKINELLKINETSVILYNNTLSLIYLDDIIIGKANDKSVKFSQLESDLLTFILNHPNEILHPDYILKIVWNNEKGNIADTIKKIRLKFDEIGKFNLIKNKRGLGYYVDKKAFEK